MRGTRATTLTEWLGPVQDRTPTTPVQAAPAPAPPLAAPDQDRGLARGDGTRRRRDGIGHSGQHHHASHRADGACPDEEVLVDDVVVLQVRGGPLNFFTSFFFVWTALHAGLRGCWQVQMGCCACLATSLVFHGTSLCRSSARRGSALFTFRKAARAVDMAVAQGCIAYFTWMCASWHWLYLLTLAAVVYLTLTYYHFNLSSRADVGHIWHATIHLVGNIGISCVVEACVATAACELCAPPR